MRVSLLRLSVIDLRSSPSEVSVRHALPGSGMTDGLLPRSLQGCAGVRRGEAARGGVRQQSEGWQVRHMTLALGATAGDVR